MTDNPRPRPRHALTDDEPVVIEPTPAPRCRLDGCGRLPEWRGLCPAHRQTHRGLVGPADPKEYS